MRSGAFVLILLMTQIGLAEESSPRPEVAILRQPQLMVTAGLPVLLSDIGGANFASASVLEKAANLVVMEPLSDGEERSFSNVELVKILKDKFGTDSGLNSLNWTYFVPEKTRVKGVKNLISQDRLSAQILRSLSEKCETCSFKINNMKIPQVKESQSLVDLSLETASLKLAGGFLLPLRVRFASNETVYYVTGQVLARNKALVVRHSLAMGEKIEAADFKTEEVEINFGNDAFAELSDLAGKTMAHAIQMGRPLYKSDLRKEVVVQRGQSIRAISGNESFEVSAQMLADENGAVGDLIRIKNPETQKLLSGTVVERGVVRIQ